MDVYAYADDDVVAGYLDAQTNEPTPGLNHAPGYRWGWANRIKYRTHQNDGLDGVRDEYIRQMPAARRDGSGTTGATQ